MCQKCGNKSCSKCSGTSNASTEALLAEMQDQLQEILTATNFLLKGHPILLIEDSDDIALFDFGTGEGFDTWQGWAVCDGQSHLSSKKKMIATPNFTDRFVVMAGGAYAVGDVGGANSVALTIPEIPAHAHTITDPGHNHAITDPGHDHGVTDPGHNHPLTDPGHNHTIPDHSHPLNPAAFDTDMNGGTGPFFPSAGSGLIGGDYGGLNTNVVSQSISTENTGITIGNAFTGIDINPAFTGISTQNDVTGITMSNTGGGGAHENRPPYYGAIYIKYIG